MRFNDNLGLPFVVVFDAALSLPVQVGYGSAFSPAERLEQPGSGQKTPKADPTNMPDMQALADLAPRLTSIAGAGNAHAITAAQILSNPGKPFFVSADFMNALMPDTNSQAVELARWLSDNIISWGHQDFVNYNGDNYLVYKDTTREPPTICALVSAEEIRLIGPGEAYQIAGAATARYFDESDPTIKGHLANLTTETISVSKAPKEAVDAILANAGSFPPQPMAAAAAVPTIKQLISEAQRETPDSCSRERATRCTSRQDQPVYGPLSR